MFNSIDWESTQGFEGGREQGQLPKKDRWRGVAPGYQGRNGFHRLSESSQRILPAPHDKEGAGLWDDEEDRYQAAVYVLQHKNTRIPSLQEMKDDIGPDGDGQLQQDVSVDRRIQGLKAQHLSDLEGLYAYHAAEYLQEARDGYYCSAAGEESAQAGVEEDIFYRWSSVVTAKRWAEDVEQERYGHLQMLGGLYREKKGLEE